MIHFVSKEQILSPTSFKTSLKTPPRTSVDFDPASCTPLQTVRCALCSTQQSTFRERQRGKKAMRKGEEEGWAAKGAKRKKGRVRTGQASLLTPCMHCLCSSHTCNTAKRKAMDARKVSVLGASNRHLQIAAFSSRNFGSQGFPAIPLSMNV